MRLVRQQFEYAMEQADLILFLVDAQTGLTPVDRQLAKMLRRQAKPVILIANKVDTAVLEPSANEFMKLGFTETHCISALHGNGIADMLDTMENYLSASQPVPCEPVMKIAIVGPRNAGKSTFINALAGEKRVIVSEMPGTTRDAVDVRFELDGQPFLAIDTAGVRKKSKITHSVDFYSLVRAERSIRRADVVLLMVDATEHIGQVTKKLAAYIVSQHKPAVIVINKWDLADGNAEIEQYADYLEKILPAMRICPISLTCANDGMNVSDTIRLAQKLFVQARTRVPTAKLNEVVEQLRARRPPRGSRPKSQPKIYYASQIETCPPTIVLFVNDRRAFTQEYQRYVVNRLHETLPFAEIPIRLIIRQRSRR